METTEGRTKEDCQGCLNKDVYSVPLSRLPAKDKVGLYAAENKNLKEAVQKGVQYTLLP